MRRRIPWGVLAVLFVVIPLVEIYLLIQVGQVIGVWWTILLLIADSILGSYLVKHEGGRAWEALRQAIESHKMPAKELADGALILIGGTLLLTPGFLSDVVGFFCILPFTRPLARRLLTGFITRKLLGGPSGGTRGPRTGTRSGTRQRPGPDSVVQGEVVD
jgi:UPF0716 protein FxsA